MARVALNGPAKALRLALEHCTGVQINHAAITFSFGDQRVVYTVADIGRPSDPPVEVGAACSIVRPHIDIEDTVCAA